MRLILYICIYKAAFRCQQKYVRVILGKWHSGKWDFGKVGFWKVGFCESGILGKLDLESSSVRSIRSE